MNDEKRPTLRPRRRVNLTASRCPISMVRAKLALDALAAGETIELVLAEGEQIQDIPRTLKQEGHRVLRVNRKGANYHLIVCKGC
jgi:tRNA 2-thiouridine synthesizing protein A